MDLHPPPLSDQICPDPIEQDRSRQKQASFDRFPFPLKGFRARPLGSHAARKRKDGFRFAGDRRTKGMVVAFYVNGDEQAESNEGSNSSIHGIRLYGV